MARLWFASADGRLWVTSRWVGWLHRVNDETGNATAAHWPAFLVVRSYGPLREVTP